MLAESEAGGGRRRSTFYVPLGENRTSSSAVDRRMLHSSTPKRSVVESPEKTPPKKIEENRSATPQRAPRTKQSPQQPLAKPLLTVTKTIEGPKVPTLMPVQKTSSMSASDRLKSPLLKVSTKLLSTSAQALEVINRSPSASPIKSPHSPLSIIRRSSSRKLSRSSSTVLKCSKEKEVPIVMVDHSPDERLLSSAADSARQRRQGKPDDEEAVHSGKDTIEFFRELSYFICFS